ncbi:MAG: B3/4 domain-containing protein [Acetivibrio ethanolgignens]
MSKFIIEKPVWDLFPELSIGIIVAKGVDNSIAKEEELKDELAAALEAANEDAKQYLTADTLSENEVISVWRKAYQQFKTKKGVRCSIEALLKRASKGNAVGNINPLVDIYNVISLKYALPCGGEDLDTFAGDLRLTKTEGGDEFLALGDEENDNTLPGEVCYLDDAGAVCRCFNWRDGVRTMLTENTKNAFLIIECIDPNRKDVMEKALAELAETTQKYLGGSMVASVLTKENPEVEL